MTEEPSGGPHFHHDANLVKEGFAQMEAQGRMPTIEEVVAINPLWRADLVKMSRTVAHRRYLRKQRRGGK